MGSNSLEKIKALLFARIQSIEFRNFRNLDHGKIIIPNSSMSDFYDGKPSVLGLYGQNGSGKTSVILALDVLKTLLSGKRLGEKYSSCIRKGCDRCSLVFSFVLYSKITDDIEEPLLGSEADQCFLVDYGVDIVHDGLKRDKNGECINDETLVIENEILKVKSQKSDGTTVIHRQVFFDTSVGACDGGRRAFGGKNKYEFFTLYNQEYQREYMDIKLVTRTESRSFIFSKEFVTLFEEIYAELYRSMGDEVTEQLKHVAELVAADNNAKNNTKDILEKMHDVSSEDIEWGLNAIGIYSVLVLILKNLRTFGRSYLHVLDTSTMGQTSINVELPLMLWVNQKGKGVYNFLVQLRMDGPTDIETKFYPYMLTAISRVSEVLTKVVPGLSIKVRDLGGELNSKGIEIQRFEIVSCRNDSTIPLKYESDGVRRILSIMSLLIAAYNDASFTIAIDELDSGLFEYLLGEFISVLSESIKGQLVFTSHNLRPLEVLPSEYLCFTTTNPNKRFVFLNKKREYNLRDYYFRNIILGSDDLGLYKATDRYEIEMALRGVEDQDNE